MYHQFSLDVNVMLILTYGDSKISEAITMDLYQIILCKYNENIAYASGRKVFISSADV